MKQFVLPQIARGIVSITGAGGKTSLMFHLANQFVRSKQKVLTTTTTKIYYPTSKQSKYVLVSDQAERVLKQIKLDYPDHRHLSVASAITRDKSKLIGFLPAEIDIFRESGLFDWIIVEADGAAGRSLKFPADHEPVIPENTDIWIGMIGLDVLGSIFSENTVFRSSLVEQKTAFKKGDLIDKNFVHQILQLPGGLTKKVPKNTFRCLFLNKADSPSQQVSGRQIGERILIQEPELFDLVVIGQTNEKIIIHDYLISPLSSFVIPNDKQSSSPHPQKTVGERCLGIVS